MPDWPHPERPKPEVKRIKPLKPARSQAELTALNQRKIQIVLVSTNVCISALIALKTFGIL